MISSWLTLVDECYLSLLTPVATTMTSQPNQSNFFKTPQPNQLQSEESRESTLEMLSKEQDHETDAINVDQDSTNPDDAPTHSPDVIEDMENLADRHPLSIDSPPG